ncbi:MAG TPA: DUF4147 domain-containing protein, partial [Anaerolineae bacterium]|nr:DUF4147 domain-containing protein [Anaerolineae bacterium]
LLTITSPPPLHTAITLSKDIRSPLPPPWQHFTGGHPLPTNNSLTATQTIRDHLTPLTKQDILLVLLSGGTSALCAAPHISLTAWIELNQALLHSGAPITAINQIRTFFDAVKGGGLTRWAYPAITHTLILNDIIGDWHWVGSRPTLPLTASLSPTHITAIFDRYQIWPHLSPATLTAIHHWLTTASPLAPSPPSPPPILLGSNHHATQPLIPLLQQHGYTPTLLTNHLQGEAREVGRVAAALALGLPPHHALILGGETTVTVTGDGRGGRNQELALAALATLANAPNRWLAAWSTDGEDFLPNVAGAFITPHTATLAHHHNLLPHTFLANNDSYQFFSTLETLSGQPALIRTGATGTNVNDLLIIGHGPSTIKDK